MSALFCSLDEFGAYDIPAMIDKVLNVTGAEHLHYIGYSIGVTSFIITMNGRGQEFRDKVYSGDFIAPPVFQLHTDSPVWLGTHFGSLMKVLILSYTGRAFLIEKKGNSSNFPQHGQNTTFIPQKM